MLRRAPVPVAFHRECCLDVEAARSGLVPSFLQLLDNAIPMVATADIGGTAAALLQESWTGVRIVELEVPRRYLAADIGRPSRQPSAARSEWSRSPGRPGSSFRSQGMRHPNHGIRMVDGFNGGWIDFEGVGEQRRGTVTLEIVIARLTGKEGTLSPASRKVGGQ